MPPVQKPRSIPPHRPPVDKRALIGGGTVLFVVLVWLLWPAAKVTNLDSRGTTVIAFGDSLTAGVGAAAGEDYPSRLAQRAGVEILNAGVSGDTTESAWSRIDADVLAHDPRIVIVGLGGNDFLRRVPIAETEANLRKIVRKIQAQGAMVVLLGFEFPSLGPSYADMYERVGADEKCLLIPDLMDGILNNQSMKSDEIHPNARGYDLMAERVEKPLEKLIERANDARR